MEDRESLTAWLERAALDQPAGGAIEDAIQGGHLDERLVAAIERHKHSSVLDTRNAAVWALIHYGGKRDLEAEAVELLVSGLIHDDDDATFGAVGYLGIMAQDGNPCAQAILAQLRRDEETRERLQLAPEPPTSTSP